MRFAELLGVVRHDGEVERAVDRDRAQRVALGIVGLQAERGSFRKAVGISRPHPRVLRTRVLRQRRVYVSVTKEGLPQRIERGAGHAFFSDGIRARRILSGSECGAASEQHSGEHADHGDSNHQMHDRTPRDAREVRVPMPTPYSR